MSTSLTYIDRPQAPDAARCLVAVGRAENLRAPWLLDWLPESSRAAFVRMVEAASPGDKGAAVSSWLGQGQPELIVAAVLPEPCSRHNSPARPHAIASLLGDVLPSTGATQVLLAVEESRYALAAGCAVARCLPAYSAKTGDAAKDEEDGRSVDVAFVGADGPVPVPERLPALAAGIRSAARLVDMPTSVLHTDAFVEEARAAAKRVGASIKVLRGEELRDKGFGGLWGVGKAAVHPPALVVLSHGPEGAEDSVAWVGKGIVYDTGGLSIKGKTNMPGMKADMGGAAAVLGAFEAAVATGTSQRLYALLCLAENSVGPEATRPDDILEMYSGKTVEVNNTDAEGRLVLADGVAYAVRHLKPSRIIDLATLTGAQLVSTGRRHAGIVCNDADLEAKTVAVGQACGDLVHPLPYCPEFFRGEFKSQVADLKNSVKDRANGQSSCAGQFVAEHLGDFDGEWLHIDLAGPATTPEDRGTGYGVALLVELL